MTQPKSISDMRQGLEWCKEFNSKAYSGLIRLISPKIKN